MMAYRKISVLIMGVMAAIAVSCSQQEEIPEQPVIQWDVLTAMEQPMSQNANQLGDRLLVDICSNYSGQNVSLSPLTAYRDLALIRRCSAGATRSESAQALGKLPIDEAYTDTIESFFFSHLPYYATHLSLAFDNSIWINWNALQERIVDNQFIRHLNDGGIIAGVLDFTQKSAVWSVNQWATVYGSTTMVDQLPQDGSIVIGDISRFYSGWTCDYFSRQSAGELTFHNADGTESRVPALQTTDMLGYYAAPEYVASSFRFGVDANLRWIIVMPEQLSLEALSKRLVLDGGLADLYAKTQMDYTNGSEVLIPQIDMQSELDLKDTFIRLGVKSAFSASLSDFSPLVDGVRLSVDQVLHKSAFHVTEKGVSSTFADVELRVWNNFYEQQPDPIARPALVYDKPFLFFVIEEKTQTVLYLGKVEKL